MFLVSCASPAGRFYEGSADLPKPDGQKKSAFRVHGTHVKKCRGILKCQEAPRQGPQSNTIKFKVPEWKKNGDPWRGISRQKNMLAAARFPFINI